MTQSERYRGLLLALCKYHENLREDADRLREKIENETVISRKSGMENALSWATQHRHASRWFLFRRKEDLEDFFGTTAPEIIAGMSFDDNEGDLSLIDKIPARKLGLRKRDENGNIMGKVTNWRLRGIDL